MADFRCSDVVRFGGDLDLAPEQAQEGLGGHLTSCQDCASYVAQMATTRQLLRRQPRPGRAHAGLDGAVPSTDPAELDAVRGTLLARARLLDPSNADDLTQRTLEIGLALQRRDSRPRGIAELSTIMHTLSDAQTRLDGRTSPAVDVTAAARTRSDALEDLDSDADEAELFYPRLYPDGDETDGWVDSPNQWRGGAQILSPEEVDETGEVYDVLDKALAELPEPLGELLTLVDLQGYALADSAHVLGLDTLSATAALARARNHVRGRLNDYLTSTEPALNERSRSA